METLFPKIDLYVITMSLVLLKLNLKGKDMKKIILIYGILLIIGVIFTNCSNHNSKNLNYIKNYTLPGETQSNEKIIGEMVGVNGNIKWDTF